jgi:hypothetical protein
VAWRNHVYDIFRDKSSPSDIRRRHLILDLSGQLEPLPLAQLSQVTPRVAAAYARKTGKTLSRDLNALMETGLLQKTEDGKYRAKKELILAFLPPRTRTQGSSTRNSS